MTNFEYMKQKIIGAVSSMDEMELLRLAEDTEMSACGAEGVFNCTACEKEFGECGTGPCNSEHNSRYLEWCKKEYKMNIEKLKQEYQSTLDGLQDEILLIQNRIDKAKRQLINVTTEEDIEQFRKENVLEDGLKYIELF